LVILRVGLRPAKLAASDVALSLGDGLVSGEATPLARAFVTEKRFREALERLGEGPAGRAAALLFGVDGATRGLPLKTRRSEAASELGVFVSTFRRLYEDDLIQDVVVELARLAG
jgi:hypothetical protein